MEEGGGTSSRSQVELEERELTWTDLQHPSTWTESYQRLCLGSPLFSAQPPTDESQRDKSTGEERR